MEDERWLEQVTAPDYARDLDDCDVGRIRAMREECRAAERRLSYTRRVLQGHLDLALAEVTRRRDAGDQAPFVARVAHALTGPAPPPDAARPARAVGLHAPDGIVVEADVAHVAELDDDALAALVDRLRRRERALSDRRGILLAHLDRLTEALVARYRSGQAVVGEAASMMDRL